jgi:hypothetical protein
VVNWPIVITHHRDTKNTELAQRRKDVEVNGKKITGA